MSLPLQSCLQAVDATHLPAYLGTCPPVTSMLRAAR